MIDELAISSGCERSEWTDVAELKSEFGTKAATLTTLPRKWTPPFVLISAKLFDGKNFDGRAIFDLGEEIISNIRKLAELTGTLIVRSSVIGETIWDRGKYESVIVDLKTAGFENALSTAVTRVLWSASSRRAGLVLQSFVKPRARGEFGNLLRVSKTRDQWELTYDDGSTTTSVRFNTQRDQAADPNSQLDIKAGVAQERLIGPVCAWLNNELLRGVSLRLSCEWIMDRQHLYVVQIDQEDEDFVGINPFQLRVAPAHHPSVEEGRFIKPASEAAIAEWDKLHVLSELYDKGEPRKPTLFYVPLSKLPANDDANAFSQLVDDFRRIVGPDNIVIRTSVRAGEEKRVNLERTEGLKPEQAARRTLELRDQLLRETSIEQYAVPSRSW